MILDHICCEASEVGKRVVNECLQRGYKIDIMKLEKLLILIQGEYLSLYDKPMFNQEVYCYKEPVGVAIREVDCDFRKCALVLDQPVKEYRAFVENEERVIDDILNKYGTWDLFALNECAFIQKLFCLSTPDNIIPKQRVKEIFNMVDIKQPSKVYTKK